MTKQLETKLCRLRWRYGNKVEDLREYIEKLNLKITFEHVVNFTWIAEVHK